MYYRPKPVSEADLALMRVIDELHLEHPFAGARMLRDLPKARGFEVGRKHVATLSKRSANPSFIAPLKLRTLRLGNQRDG